MKKRLLLIQVVVCASLFSYAQAKISPARSLPGIQPSTKQATTSLPNGASENWLNAAQSELNRSAYFFKKTGEQYIVPNRRQQAAFLVGGGTVITRPLGAATTSWSSSLQLLGVSKGGPAFDATTPTVNQKENYLQFNYPGFTVEYLNNEQGLRQNFIISSKPAGDADLQVSLAVSGDLVASLQGNTLSLKNRSNNKTVLKYDDLVVWDANHKALKAVMEMGVDNHVKLVVEDAEAIYPVTIDPLTHTEEFSASAAGLLPGLLNTLALQVDALYGYKVAGVGDVNGDGYDDVAIGAPGAIDVIGAGTVVGAGAVFVYFGSDTGLSTLPGRTLRATTPIANALFGFSIAGGNVSGDSKSDIVVGAPGESYNTATSGTTGSATVTAGKVYVFRGQDLAAGPATPFATVFLDGSGFFSTGLGGVLLSNVTINALFGFSVATTDDMNADGLGEIVVGSPGYAGTALLDVRSGAAFVYFSSNIAGNTPVKLNAPSLIGFPDLVNTNGLLFGFSVDGAGDYDGDTRPDIVVGAPGGLSLSLGNLLGGSAYVFKGAGGTSINATPVRLKASGTIVGAIANLFGYSVKAVKNASGVRTGGIVVGAPAGNLLSNITGGLRLKTGSINVFPKNTGATGSISPTQSFSSPRSANLLAILNGQNLDVDALFGASIDNMFDANCDGIGDIIVGEPLSTGVGIINTNAVGGAVYIFAGNAGGTYSTTPYWTLENTVSSGLGINAASLIGYTVAGAGHTRGGLKSVRALIGAPGKALDFNSGLLNLGNTLGTLLSFAAGDNGLGKAYVYGFSCDVVTMPDINATHVNVSVPGNVSTNDFVPANTTYGTPVPQAGNPGGGTLTVNANGTYMFISTTPGVFTYQVPVCIPVQGCTMSMLTITVLSTAGTAIKPPVANTDLAYTLANTPVTINSLANDAPGSIGMLLNPASVTIITTPQHGMASVLPLTGQIVYTPAAGFQGPDTLFYQVCDFGAPTPLCATAIQVITVKFTGAANSTAAADDFINTPPNVTAFGNVKLNDTDPEGNNQLVDPQSTTISGKGTLVLAADGSYTFSPVARFTGPVSFVYHTCDDGVPQYCANATLYILVTAAVNPDLTPSTRISNGTFIESASTARNFVIEVNEILGNAIDNNSVPVQVRVNKSDNFSYTFDPAATTATVPATITVNNGAWDLITNTSTTMLFQLRAGNNIAALNTSSLLINLQVQAGAAEGVENQTVVIINGSGTEINYMNNSVVRILNIVP